MIARPVRTRTAHFQPVVILAMVVLLVLANGRAFAQIQLTPVGGGSYAGKESSRGRIQSHEPVSLPFWDDFSGQAPGWPDSLWVHSASVFVSEGIGINPPSINVAVLDGLDSLGRAYNPNEPTLNGFTDKLISCEIVMDEVPVPERNTVYLSFFYQWSGRAEAPDRTDYLQIDFKNSSGAWILMKRIYGDEVDDPTIFNTAMIQVMGEEFFHPGFRFRIRSYGRLSGPYDTWAIDCVYLNKGRDGVSVSFPDRAIASTLTPFYGKYYAMPYMHFLLDKKLDSIRFDAYNLRGPVAIPAATSYDILATFTNYTEGVPSFYSVAFIADQNPNQGFEMQPLERINIRMDVLPDINDPLQFDPEADSVDVMIKMKLNSDDVNDDTKAPFEPLDFTVNDTLSKVYPLRNYYAYDDGSAEYSVQLGESGDRLAYRFSMPVDTASLSGFYIYFPYTGGSSTETMDLFVYGDEDGKPADSPLISLLSRTINKTGRNKFTLVKIVPPLFINDSVFYVGYRQPTSQTIKLGVDKNTDTGDKIFVDTGAKGWEQNTFFTGSLMIRPVIVKGNGVVSGLPEEDPALAIYPNPNNGTFFVPAGVTGLHITDVTGRSIGWRLEEENNERKRIALTHPVTGLYLVRWADREGVYTTKVVVRQ